MLRVSIAGMAGATILMALLPGYATLGITATALFVLLRLVQGFCLGGEIPGAMVMITETLPTRRGLAIGTLFLMINCGLLLAHLVQWLVINWLSTTEIVQYGWRSAFLLGGIIAFIGYILRARLSESPAFAALESHIHKVPLWALLRKNSGAVLLGFLITGLGAATVSMLYLYMDSYLNTFLHYPEQTVAFAGLMGIIVFSLPMPLAGWIADRAGLKAPAVIAALLMAAATLPIYYWLLSGPEAVLPAMLVISLLAAFAWGVGPTVLTALFPTNVRYSGVALVYNLGFAIVGGLTPVMATALIQTTGYYPAPGYILLTFTLLAAIATLIAKLRPVSD